MCVKYLKAKIDEMMDSIRESTDARFRNGYDFMNLSLPMPPPMLQSSSEDEGEQDEGTMDSPMQLQVELDDQELYADVWFIIIFLFFSYFFNKC